MNEGRSGHYEEAAQYLARARAGALAAGKPDEWRAYINGVLTTHGRKYKLVPLLRPLA